MSGMSLIVRTVAKFTVGTVMLYGLYLGLVGHLTLGGGITAGVIVALALVLEVLAFGVTQQQIDVKIKNATGLMSLAFLVWLTMAAVGWILPGKGEKFLLANFLPHGEAGTVFSAGVIPWYNLLLMLILGNALFAVFLTLVKFRIRMIEGK